MPAKTALHVIAKRPATFGFKDKQREQRKKIIKMCVQKLRDIDDPETVLCRAVLINNTFKTLKYAQRRMQVKKSELRRLKVEEEEEVRKEECEHEEEEEQAAHDEEEDGSSSDTENETSPDIDHITPIENIERTEVKNNFDETTDIEDLTNPTCDINSYNTESIVHSLVMPPLLSPQLEDMTNCSFYDSFTPSAQPVPAGTISSENSSSQRFSGHISGPSDSLNGSLKMTVMKADLCDVISESNRNLCPKSDFSHCSSGVQSDLGDSLLIDNLLTEIVQA